MVAHTEIEHGRSDSLHKAISNAVVRLMHDYTGRGPTKSRAIIRDNIVLVLLEQTLTKGEESLVRMGRSDKVLEMRREFQEAMREESMARISEITGRQVTALLSSNHVAPDMGAEIFVLDGPPEYD